MTTVLEVLDTAVKIGLGASISAIGAFWHSKAKSKADSKKEYESRHRSLLEQVAESAEEINHVYLKYWALVVEWVRYNQQGNEWPQNRRDELDLIKSEFFSVFSSLTNAESKLLLIGEQEAYLKLREIGKTVISFRRTFFVDKAEMSEEQMEAEKTKIRDLREDFYSLLSNAYKRSFT